MTTNNENGTKLSINFENITLKNTPIFGSIFGVKRNNSRIKQKNIDQRNETWVRKLHTVYNFNKLHGHAI